MEINKLFIHLYNKLPKIFQDFEHLKQKYSKHITLT